MRLLVNALSQAGLEITSRTYIYLEGSRGQECAHSLYPFPATPVETPLYLCIGLPLPDLSFFIY